jgi:toxin-antitoxin system PIN domain toxin
MTSLSFPDVNVWLALSSHDHVHSSAARKWWNAHAGVIAFNRFTQIGLLRLVTTSAVMNRKPLTIAQAWLVYDRFFEDDRVSLVPEPMDVEASFRKNTTAVTVSPKIWAEAWLLAFAETAGGVLVTLDKALASRGAHYLLEKKG